MPKKHVSDNTKKKVNFDQIEITEKKYFCIFWVKRSDNSKSITYFGFFFQKF